MSFCFSFMAGFIDLLTVGTGIYYEDRVNVCFVLIPDMWQFRVAIAVEHLIFLGFFSIKSFLTPRCVFSLRLELARKSDTPPNCRTADTAFLRVLLADGIWYFTVTLGASLFSILVRRDVYWVGKTSDITCTVMELSG